MRGLGAAAVDPPPDAVFDQNHVEVDQQSEPEAGQHQVGVQLRLVNGQQSFGCFDFDDNHFIDDQIHAIANFYGMIPVDQGQSDLAPERDLPRGQFVSDALLIGRLKKSRPKRFVDGECSVHNLPCNMIVLW